MWCAFEGLTMFYPEDKGANEISETTEDQHLVLDGTVNLEYSEDERIPRVKGLLELINQYFRDKKEQNL